MRHEMPDTSVKRPMRQPMRLLYWSRGIRYLPAPMRQPMRFGCRFGGVRLGRTDAVMRGLREGPHRFGHPTLRKEVT